MKHQIKLTREQQSQQIGSEQQTQASAAREFASPEEMLRHDARNTTVPPEIARRLRQSTAEAQRPKASWWRRYFGKGEA